jgi:hypothetical protein
MEVAMASRRDQLVGNRLALAGTVLYFTEWVVIPFAPSLPTDRLGHDPAATVAAYADHPGTTALLAGWLSFVLLGRIAFCAGLRNAFRASPRELALADWAFGAMVVSVAIEVLCYALVATGGWLADAGSGAGTIVALDAAGTVLFYLVFAPVGLSVAAGSLAMLISGLFPRWIVWLGLVAGPLVLAGGVVGASAAGSTGGFHDVGAALGGLPLVGFWVWIIATSVVLFRHAPRQGVRDRHAG